MGKNIVVDHKYLKGKIKEHKEIYGHKENFDREFLLSEEKSKGIRYVDVNQCGDSFNARVFMQTPNGEFTTGTVKIPDYRNHDTTLIHVDSICGLVGERASKGPEPNADSLTIAACNSIGDKNGVIKRTSATRAYINQFV